jgi:hypothetical protein
VAISEIRRAKVESTRRSRCFNASTSSTAKLSLSNLAELHTFRGLMGENGRAASRRAQRDETFDRIPGCIEVNVP